MSMRIFDRVAGCDRNGEWLLSNVWVVVLPREPGKIYDREKQVRNLLGDRRNRHPAGGVPDQDDLAVAE
jgi:hypothetical protein